jgi:hypothetical protein
MRVPLTVCQGEGLSCTYIIVLFSFRETDFNDNGYLGMKEGSVHV